jgi:hypothetical protein
MAADFGVARTEALAHASDRRRQIRRLDDRLRDAMVPIPPAVALGRDRVHWGAVWSGLFAALTLVVLLNVLGLAVGLTFGTQPGTGGRRRAVRAGRGPWCRHLGRRGRRHRLPDRRLRRRQVGGRPVVDH